ncbi:MAG: amidohydrolase family protein [Spirochaetes bacterium]|nr:amidohydrolase family protein [Spirochaetota bacterium]
MADAYSLVLVGGRILDPKTNRDEVVDIGIFDGKIVEIGRNLDTSRAEDAIDLSGKWVIPGVIDPHVHISSWIGEYPGLRMMASEGVITALDMAGPPESVWKNVKEHGSGMHIACLDAITQGDQEEESPSKGRIGEKSIGRRIASALERGALGVKILGGHYPLTPETTARIIREAKRQGSYVAFHAGTIRTGSNLEGMREAIQLSDGNPLHLAHINSYCRGYVKDPHLETYEALQLLKGASHIWSESYVNVFNGTSGKCTNGQILSQVTRTCCRVGGYSEDEVGLGKAIRDGFGHVTKMKGGMNVLVTGEEGYRYWKERGTDVTMSFPVNLLPVQIVLASAKDSNGSFIVDAFSTDGGGIPRNTMVRHALDLVRLGVLSPLEMAQKLSTRTAIMLGLKSKGTLSVGADADVTVLDPQVGRACLGIAGGQIIMVEGRVVGRGGTLITSAKGVEKVKEWGLPFQIMDPAEALPRKQF